MGLIRAVVSDWPISRAGYGYIRLKVRVQLNGYFRVFDIGL